MLHRKTQLGLRYVQPLKVAPQSKWLPNVIKSPCNGTAGKEIPICLGRETLPQWPLDYPGVLPLACPLPRIGQRSRWLSVMFIPKSALPPLCEFKSYQLRLWLRMWLYGPHCNLKDTFHLTRLDRAKRKCCIILFSWTARSGTHPRALQIVGESPICVSTLHRWHAVIGRGGLNQYSEKTRCPSLRKVEARETHRDLPLTPWLLRIAEQVTWHLNRERSWNDLGNLPCQRKKKIPTAGFSMAALGRLAYCHAASDN